MLTLCRLGRDSLRREHPCCLILLLLCRAAGLWQGQHHFCGQQEGPAVAGSRPSAMVQHAQVPLHCVQPHAVPVRARPPRQSWVLPNGLCLILQMVALGLAHQHAASSL